jgi:BMFP domain-containing protein YqiC
MTPFQDQPKDVDFLPAESIVRMWNGYPIRFDPATERLSFTDMWKPAGAERRKKSSLWIPNKNIQALAQEITQGRNSCLEAGTGFEPYVVIHGGPNAGTWGCIELALAYAEFLDPKFWLWVLRTFVQARTGQLVPAHQTPAVDLAPVMAKLDSLAARLEALEAQVTSSQEADSAAPRGAEIIVARLLDALSKNAAENALRLNELENRLAELEQRLRCDAIDGRHNIRQFIKTELAKQLDAALSPLSAASAPPMSETPSSPLSRVESEAWARLIAAWWSLFGGKRRAAREIVALAEAGLFDAATQAGRSRQFAVAAERSEGISYPVQDGALIVRLRRGERKAGLPFLYWLEPVL